MALNNKSHQKYLPDSRNDSLGIYHEPNLLHSIKVYFFGTDPSATIPLYCPAAGAAAIYYNIKKR
jgi:hypothetical protein